MAKVEEKWGMNKGKAMTIKKGIDDDKEGEGRMVNK